VTFQSWWNRGYGASIIPIVSQQKNPAINSWQTMIAVEEDIKRWDRKKYNIGLQTANYPCLDIDFADSQAVEAIHKAAIDTCGCFSMPLRTRIKPRCALLFRLKPGSAPMSKMVRTYTHPVRGSYKLEMLGGGQQVVLDGYFKDKERPANSGAWDWTHRPTVKELPTMDRIRRAEMFHRIDAALKALGWKNKSGTQQRPRQGAKTSKEGQVVSKHQRHLVVEIFDELPNDYDRDDWFNIGQMAFASAGDDDELRQKIFDAWDAWSRSHEVNTGDNAKAWASMDPEYLGFGTLVYIGKRECPKWYARFKQTIIPPARDEFSAVSETDPFVEALSTGVWASFRASIPPWMKDMNERIAMLSQGVDVLYLMEPGVKRDKPDLKRKIGAMDLMANLPPIPNSKNPKLKPVPVFDA